MTSPRDAVPRGLRKGRVVRRQSSFWDLESGFDGWRIHFRGKREAHFVSPAFVGPTISANHPLLATYLEDNDRLFVSTGGINPEILLAELEATIVSLTSGSRSLSSFADQGADLVKILESGSGLLCEVPRSFVDPIQEVLSRGGVRSSFLPGRESRGRPQVLILGRNFVVADHFEFEPLRRK